MTRSIKLFRHVRKFYRMVGIHPPKSKHHHQHRFNVKNSLSSVFLALFSISIAWYLLFEANTTDEYGQCFTGFVSVIEISVYFIVNFSKIESILKLIKKIEEFIEMSESDENVEIQTILLSLVKKKTICACSDLCQIGAPISASAIMYKTLKRKIEKLSKRMYTTLMSSMIFGFFVPNICLSLVNFYFLDMADESFALPVPMMYIFIET